MTVNNHWGDQRGTNHGAISDTTADTHSQVYVRIRAEARKGCLAGTASALCTTTPGPFVAVRREAPRSIATVPGRAERFVPVTRNERGAPGFE
jgi:hypothetical protein